MEQNSKEWLEWRRSKIAASDMPIIAGLSPYKTPFQLWEQKIGLKPEDPPSFITDIGHEFEKKARARFELETGIEVEPIIAINKNHDWITASLDAASIAEEITCEIKYMGKGKLEMVRATGLPLPHHYPQIQWQFAASGFKRGYYVCYTLDKEYKEMTDYLCIETKMDEEYIFQTLYPLALEFKKCVDTKTPPELTPKDIRRLKKSSTPKVEP